MSTDQILASQTFGDGTPVLVIHGWQMNGRAEALDLEPIFTSFSGYRRIYVDLPGMGSTPGDNIENQDDIFLRLVRFVDATIATSRFLVIGSSLGAYLARAIGARYRQQVDGLLLRVPVIEPDNSKRNVDAFQPLVANAELMAGLFPSRRKFLGEMIVQTPEYISASESRLVTVENPAVQESDAALLDPIRCDPQRYSISSKLFDVSSEKHSAPTLILCGRQDDVVGYRDALRLLELYPRSTFAVLDRATHALPVDDKRNVYESLVSDWLDRVQEWQAHRT